MFRQKELLDQEGYVVVGSTIKSQHRKKLFNSARATPESLPLASYGLTLSLKTQAGLTAADPRRNSSSECYDDDDLRALNQIRLRSTKRETTSTTQFIHNFCQSIRFWSKVAACKKPQTLNSQPRAWVHVMVCYYAPPVIHGI